LVISTISKRFKFPDLKDTLNWFFPALPQSYITQHWGSDGKCRLIQLYLFPGSSSYCNIGHISLEIGIFILSFKPHLKKCDLIWLKKAPSLFSIIGEIIATVDSLFVSNGVD